MQVALLWSNDPKLYESLLGVDDACKPVVKTNCDPRSIIDKFGLREEEAEPWMGQLFRTGNHICIVCEIDYPRGLEPIYDKFKEWLHDANK